MYKLVKDYMTLCNTLQASHNLQPHLLRSIEAHSITNHSFVDHAQRLSKFIGPTIHILSLEPFFPTITTPTSFDYLNISKKNFTPRSPQVSRAEHNPHTSHNPPPHVTSFLDYFPNSPGFLMPSKYTLKPSHHC